MGRNSRWPLVESALKIDIRELGKPSHGKPRGIFSPDATGLNLALRFRPSGAEVLLSFHFGDTYSSMRLCYHTEQLGTHADWIRWSQAIDETITLQRFPQPFGGHRWYFICPTANRRCQTLYLPHGASRFRSRWGFRCRFQYQSQRLSRPWRLKHRAERIARQVLDRGPKEFRQEYVDYAFPQSHPECGGGPITNWMSLPNPMRQPASRR